jgi:hypothetical protein
MHIVERHDHLSATEERRAGLWTSGIMPHSYDLPADPAAMTDCSLMEESL